MDIQDSDIARADFQQNVSLTALGSGQLIFDLPAAQGQWIDLRSSRLVLNFTWGSNPSRESTLGWMHGLLAYSSVRLYLNGKSVGTTGNLCHFNAFHRALFQRAYAPPCLSGYISQDLRPEAPPEQLVSGITSPWHQPTTIRTSTTPETSSAQFGFNEWAWTGAMYDLTRANFVGETLQIVVPLDLVLGGICDDGMLLDNSVTNIRLELIQSNLTFEPCKATTGLTIVPGQAVLWARRVTLTEQALVRVMQKWIEESALRYRIRLFPSSTTFLVPPNVMQFSCTVLASGQRPAQMVIHFVQPASLDLGTWVASTGVAPFVLATDHVFQCDTGNVAPAVSSLMVRSGTAQFPYLYTIQRGPGTEGGTAVIDYEQYRQSCKAYLGPDVSLQPFLSYPAFTDQFGCNLITVNLLDNSQSTWAAPMTVDRTSLDVQIQFLTPVPATGLGLVVTVLSQEEVVITPTGSIGTSF